jgi:hypothetical protein
MIVLLNLLVFCAVLLFLLEIISISTITKQHSLLQTYFFSLAGGDAKVQSAIFKDDKLLVKLQNKVSFLLTGEKNFLVVWNHQVVLCWRHGTRNSSPFNSCAHNFMPFYDNKLSGNESSGVSMKCHNIFMT